jgi:hypothetical protein
MLSVLVALSGSEAGAQDAGQTVKGVVTSVDLKGQPPRLVVRLDDGVEVEPTLARKVRVAFRPGVWRFDSAPAMSDLQPGMTVQFEWDPRGIRRVRVLEVPPDARPGGGYDVPAPPSWGGAKALPDYEAGREFVARILGVNAAGGSFDADVDGRRQTFLADVRDLRSLRVGGWYALVTGEGGRVVSVRPTRPAER